MIPARISVLASVWNSERWNLFSRKAFMTKTSSGRSVFSEQVVQTGICKNYTLSSGGKQWILFFLVFHHGNDHAAQCEGAHAQENGQLVLRQLIPGFFHRNMPGYSEWNPDKISDMSEYTEHRLAPSLISQYCTHNSQTPPPESIRSSEGSEFADKQKRRFFFLILLPS